MDEDRIRGWKCKVCGHQVTKDEAFSKEEGNVCVCIDCEQEKINYLGANL